MAIYQQEYVPDRYEFGLIQGHFGIVTGREYDALPPDLPVVYRLDTCLLELDVSPNYCVAVVDFRGWSPEPPASVPLPAVGVFLFTLFFTAVLVGQRWRRK